MNAKLNRELADFLARRGEYEADIDVYQSPGPFTRPRSLDAVSPAVEGTAPASVAGFDRAEGVKCDSGKAPLSWLGQVSRALDDVARSLAYGARKYSPSNWRRVPDGSRRYRDAALRHLMADLRGERMDPEQVLPHVTIAALNLMLAAEHDLGFDDDGEAL